MVNCAVRVGPSVLLPEATLFTLHLASLGRHHASAGVAGTAAIPLRFKVFIVELDRGLGHCAKILFLTLNATILVNLGLFGSLFGGSHSFLVLSFVPLTLALFFHANKGADQEGALVHDDRHG